jgi:uncharacterized protein
MDSPVCDHRRLRTSTSIQVVCKVEFNFYTARVIPRLIRTVLEHRLATYPAVAIVGPRQAGKTTLAQDFGGRYFDLEQETDQLRLDLAWEEAVASTDLVILDEVQVAPTIFPRLRGAIDRDRARSGRFLLLGSVAPTLMTQVSESLAGRLSLLELTPLLAAEVGPTFRHEQLWLCGGFPDGGVLEPRSYPQWQIDYLALITQRDLPALGLTASPQTVQRLLRMLGALHGQQWNASQVGSGLDLSYHTINRYVDYLVGTFLVRRLEPYTANIGKRLVKRPKIYWRDSGLLHSILGVSNHDALLSHPSVGASWEGFVIEQILGYLSATGKRCSAYYFRTSDGYELDLVLDFGTQKWAIETKLTTSPTSADMDRLVRVGRMMGADRYILISQVAMPAMDNERASVGLQHLQGLLEEAP